MLLLDFFTTSLRVPTYCVIQYHFRYLKRWTRVKRENCCVQWSKEEQHWKEPWIDPSLIVIVNDTVNLFHGSYHYLTVSEIQMTVCSFLLFWSLFPSMNDFYFWFVSFLINWLIWPFFKDEIPSICVWCTKWTVNQWLYHFTVFYIAMDNIKEQQFWLFVLVYCVVKYESRVLYAQKLK